MGSQLSINLFYSGKYISVGSLLAILIINGFPSRAIDFLFFLLLKYILMLMSSWRIFGE